MTRTSRVEWIKCVERWRASKLSAEAFATQIGVKAVRLRYWDWKLKQDRPQPAAASPPPPSSFVEVSAALPIERSPIESVVPRGYVVRVQSDVDQQFLKRVLEAVR
jgi:hypothetical protein